MWRLLVLLLAFGFTLSACTDPPPAGFRSTDISGAEIGNSLAAFQDHQGRAITLADFKGKAVVLFFGYTSCPDVCPTTLARLGETMKQLSAEAERVQVLMVTVDPERDTQERLAAYMSAFNPSFLGLRGDQLATEAAAKAFKVFVKAEAPKAAAHAHDVAHADGHENPQEKAAAPVLIDHSTGAYVFDPTGRIRLYVRDDASTEATVSDLKLLLAGK